MEQTEQDTGEALARVLFDVMQTVHANSRSHGFWPEGEERNVGEMIALVHSELSEALEGYRQGNGPSDHIPDFSYLEEELADAVIRIFDMAGGLHLELPDAIIAKIKYNANRPHKHGKNF